MPELHETDSSKTAAPLGDDRSRIILASPREPSGGSWLINGLLELGVRVNLKTAVDRVFRSVNNMCAPAAMWRPAADGGWQLHRRADSLRKWLPVLSRQEILHFRDAPSVFYVQDLPRTEFSGAHTVLFVRDPRDAIQSYYRRIRPGMSLQDFARFPHPETLLDAVTHWRLFVESWLARDNVHVYRFEDYKADAAGLLQRICADLGIEATTEQITSAAFESSYEKAREAEERYRALHPGDDEIAMRAGRVGEWKDKPDLLQFSREIERRIGPLLARLGYPCDEAIDIGGTIEGASHVRLLSVFNRVELPPEWRAAGDTCAQLPRTLMAISTVNESGIHNVRYHAREARQLLDSASEFAENWRSREQQRLQALRQAFENGSDYQMSRIAELANQVRTRVKDESSSENARGASS